MKNPAKKNQIDLLLGDSPGDDAGGTNSPPTVGPMDRAIQKINKSREQALKKTAERKEILADVEQEQSAHEAKFTGKCSQDIVDEQMEQLVWYGAENKLIMFPVVSKNEYPSFMARNPIFIPVDRNEQKKLTDAAGNYSFDTSWGRGYRLGPNVNTFDEDVLIALLKQKTKHMEGNPMQFPYPIEDFKEQDNVRTRVIICTIKQIIDFLELHPSGQSYEMVHASLKNLSALHIHVERFSKNSATKIPPEGHHMQMLKAGGFNILKYKLDSHVKECVVFVQLDPYFTFFLEKEFFFVNWNIRKQLPPIGKAIYRFLCSHRDSAVNMPLKVMKNAIGYHREIKYFRRDLDTYCKKLADLGCLLDYAIIGNGRNQPFELSITRVPRKTLKAAE